MEHPVTILHSLRSISVSVLFVCVYMCMWVCVCGGGEVVGIGCVGRYVKAVDREHLIEFPSTLENCCK